MGAWGNHMDQGAHPLVEQDGVEARRRVAVGVSQEGVELVAPLEEGGPWGGPISTCS